MNHNPPIGITGLAKSGKTTFAKALAKALCANGDVSPRILPFAYPLKKLAKSMGWNGEKDAKGRRLLQLLGTECGRECIDDDIWVNKWRDAQANMRKKMERCKVIADDVRFENEAALIRRLGGVIIRIGRPGIVAEDHVSERGVVVADYTVHNDGDIALLTERAKALWLYMRHLEGRTSAGFLTLVTGSGKPS